MKENMRLEISSEYPKKLRIFKATFCWFTVFLFD